MKRYLLATIAVCIFFVLLLSFCSKFKGNPVGSDFFQRLNPDAENAFIRYPASSDTFYTNSTTLGKSPYLLLGANDKAYSRLLLHFTFFPDSFEVDSAVISMDVSQHKGADQNCQLTIE